MVLVLTWQVNCHKRPEEGTGRLTSRGSGFIWIQLRLGIGSDSDKIFGSETRRERERDVLLIEGPNPEECGP